MSAFGGPARTPVFDRLAQHGLSYTRRAITWRPTWPTRRSAGSSDRSPSSPTSPGSRYYAPNGHKPPVDREVPGRVRRRLQRTPGSHPRAAEGAGNRLCRHRTVAVARGAAVVGRAHRQGPDGRCTLDGSLLRRRRAHRPPGRPNRRGGDQMGELDNTLVVFIAGDNGPTPDGDAQGMLVTMGGETVDSPSTCWRAYRRSSTTGSGESGTGSPRRNRCPRTRRPSASTSPTTAAA